MGSDSGAVLVVDLLRAKALSAIDEAARQMRSHRMSFEFVERVLLGVLADDSVLAVDCSAHKVRLWWESVPIDIPIGDVGSRVFGIEAGPPASEDMRRAVELAISSVPSTVRERAIYLPGGVR